MGLPDITRNRFQPIFDELVKKIAPSAIICFGYSSSIINRTNCFQTKVSEQHHLDLLVVQGKSGSYKDHEVIDLIKSRFSEELSVNVISHSMQSVCNALAEKHPFFYRIFMEGDILFQNNDIQLEIDLIQPNGKTPKQSNPNKNCTESFDLARDFLMLASHAISRKKHDIGVFLLHQAMEQLCIASINAHLQYRPTSHNILRLITLVCCYIPTAKDVFPCNTTDERQLFDFLKKAYSDVRYKMNYQTPAHIACSLIKRVTEFKDLIEHQYEETFGKIKKMKSGQTSPSSANEKYPSTVRMI